MVQIEGITRKWGNSSLVLVIPKEVALKENIKENQKVKALIVKEDNTLKKSFGIFKNWKKPTRKIMAEIDKELWFEK